MGIGLLQVLIAYGTLDYSNNYALQGLVKTGVVQINTRTRLSNGRI